MTDRESLTFSQRSQGMSIAWICALVCLVLATGCVRLPPPTDISGLTATELAQRVTVNRSDFAKGETRTGMLLYGGLSMRSDSGLTMLSSIRCLRTIIAPGGARLHQLYISVTYDATSWTFYSRAADDNGNPWPVVSISRHVEPCSMGTCIHSEDVAVGPLPEAYLRTKAATGVRFHVTANDGTRPLIVALPANYIAGQLAALP